MKTTDPTHAKLFEFTTPHSLQKSLHYVLFNYLNQKDLVLPDNFQTIIEDIYFLLAYLQEAQEQQLRSGNHQDKFHKKQSFLTFQALHVTK
ncbi:hypothetical protein GGR22_000569 [Flavobacterium gossypii]|uniref:Uncharacterized protein n=1 Tax=Flavobacterium gossypii TaxID=1646119 RepID=A0ABR6DLX4_9FLAO|nr:hypothetical protein [Flavobacterium gossypii]MBA9072443.1 hypothetical protein [Flavobacterium gossypii]